MLQDETPKEQWAIVNLMGHVQTAGRIELGALLRVDVPDTSNAAGYRTSFYGTAAIYSIDIVSEEIARAYADRTPDIVGYDAPVVTRKQYEETSKTLMDKAYQWREKAEDAARQLRALGVSPSAQISLPETGQDDQEEAPF
jgi:hypothetical protein